MKKEISLLFQPLSDRFVSIWFSLLNLDRNLPDSQERWMILVECNKARSVIILN